MKIEICRWKDEEPIRYVTDFTMSRVYHSCYSALDEANKNNLYVYDGKGRLINLKREGWISLEGLAAKQMIDVTDDVKLLWDRSWEVHSQ